MKDLFPSPANMLNMEYKLLRLLELFLMAPISQLHIVRLALALFSDKLFASISDTFEDYTNNMRLISLLIHPTANMLMANGLLLSHNLFQQSIFTILIKMLEIFTRNPQIGFSYWPFRQYPNRKQISSLVIMPSSVFCKLA